ncbi:MAG: cytochrome c3 family protein [Acidobacteriota bacterium]
MALLPRIDRVPQLIGLLCLVGTGRLLAQEVPDYVGIDTCEVCHDEEAQSLRRSPHWAIYRLKPEAEQSRVCESCHGPGSQHVDDPSNPLLNFRDGSTQKRTEACRSCHAQQGARHNVHLRAGLACDSCHTSGHGVSSNGEEEGSNFTDPLLIQAEAPLCASCHAEQKAEMQLPFRHRTLDGALLCSGCHDPHGQSLQRTSVSLIPDRTCLDCHTEKEGPFVFEHLASTVTGCMSCHAPHGSTNPRLLVRSDVRFLCLECHSETPTFHDLTRDRFQNCTLCHTAIHGSQVDGTLLR